MKKGPIVLIFSAVMSCSAVSVVRLAGTPHRRSEPLRDYRKIPTGLDVAVAVAGCWKPMSDWRTAGLALVAGLRPRPELGWTGV